MALTGWCAGRVEGTYPVYRGVVTVQGPSSAWRLVVVVVAQEMKLCANEAGTYALGVKRQLLQQPQAGGEAKPSA